MNSWEQKDVKNSGALCDGPSHNHSRRQVDRARFEQETTERTEKRSILCFLSYLRFRTWGFSRPRITRIVFYPCPSVPSVVNLFVPCPGRPTRRVRRC